MSFDKPIPPLPPGPAVTINWTPGACLDAPTIGQAISGMVGTLSGVPIGSGFAPGGPANLTRSTALTPAADPVADAIAAEPHCEQCGCTEFNACRHPRHGNCWWVRPGLCSHCAHGWGNVA